MDMRLVNTHADGWTPTAPRNPGTVNEHIQGRASKEL